MSDILKCQHEDWDEYFERCGACGMTVDTMPPDIKRAWAATRLEDLREELRGECISYGELAELASLAEYIEDDDVELLEAAGVPEGSRA